MSFDYLSLNIISDALDFFLHLDQHLVHYVNEYRDVIYIILFLIIFTETGLVVMPFLPGDSLLFAAGMIAGMKPGQVHGLTETAATAVEHPLNIWILYPMFIIAALTGDNVNYFIGNKLGVKIFDLKIKTLKREYLDRTQAFFEKHGGKTIIIARYIPIVRTFTPFIAGMGSMKYPRFLMFSSVAAVIWVSLFCLGGYFFGQNPWVQRNFEFVILGILATSFLPVAVKIVQNFLGKRKEKKGE